MDYEAAIEEICRLAAAAKEAGIRAASHGGGYAAASEAQAALEEAQEALVARLEAAERDAYTHGARVATNSIRSAVDLAAGLIVKGER